jgi:SAM-dependent methyltransferase
VYSRSAPYYDLFHSDKNYEGEAADLHQLIQLRAPGAKTLLDVACGTGRHLEYLRRDYDAEGVEIEPRLLETARKRLPGVPLHAADMLTLDLGRRFDAVLCLFCGIGYARTTEGLRRAVGALARHLEPQGVLVLEPWLTPVGGTLGPFAETFEADGVKLARVGYGRRENGVFVTENRYLVAGPEGVERFDERHELGLFSHADYHTAFAAAGLSCDLVAERYVGTHT